MSHSEKYHKLVIEGFNNGEYTGNYDDPSIVARVECTAPPYSLCRAVFDCGCEEWWGEGVTINGEPFHLDSNNEVHIGRFSDECKHVEYFAQCHSPVKGRVEVPVDVSWDEQPVFMMRESGTVVTENE